MIKNFIGGEWVESRSQLSVEVLNPATEELLERCPLGSLGDVELAVEAAEAAYASWRQTPVIDRVQPLFRLKALMEENFEDLARMVTLENGKTLVEARGSVRRGIQMIETACGTPSLMLGQVAEDIAPGIDSQAVKQPMGVFAGIMPANFPAMVPFWFWPFAVACGNTYILKPSERVPLTQVKICTLIEKAGFPKGVVNLVNGGKDVVDALCTHPKIRGVSFVGSTPVAKHVYTTACASGKRVQALGGAKNTMVVLPDAIMDKSVATALESIIGCAGQRCLAGSIVLCVGDVAYKTVTDKIVKAAADVSIGDGLDPNTQMGPVISQQSKDRILNLIQSALDEGATMELDGRLLNSDESEKPEKGFFLRPTVLSGVTREMRIAQEEVFGPVVLLSKTDSLDNAIEWVNSSGFANTTTLFTTSGAAARQFSYEVHPSMVGINIGVPAPMSYFSFGGSKDSFFGDVKVHGQASIGFFTDTKVTIHRWVKDSSIW